MKDLVVKMFEKQNNFVWFYDYRHAAEPNMQKWRFIDWFKITLKKIIAFFVKTLTFGESQVETNYLWLNSHSLYFRSETCERIKQDSLSISTALNTSYSNSL